MTEPDRFSDPDDFVSPFDVAPIEHKCSECGGDAYIGMRNWKRVEDGKVLIGKDERLCFACAKKRGAPSPFQKEAAT